jgi:hypothetical protein
MHDFCGFLSFYLALFFCKFMNIILFYFELREKQQTLFTQLVLLLSGKGYVSLYVEYIDGTKIESKANKYKALLTDGWLLWEHMYVSSFAILIKIYFDEVLNLRENSLTG